MVSRVVSPVIISGHSAGGGDGGGGGGGLVLVVMRPQAVHVPKPEGCR